MLTQSKIFVAATVYKLSSMELESNLFDRFEYKNPIKKGRYNRQKLSSISFLIISLINKL